MTVAVPEADELWTRFGEKYSQQCGINFITDAGV